MSAAAVPVSVGVFCYNQGQYVAQCLESVLTQDPPPAAVFVVDDGSSDNSMPAARSAAARFATTTLVTFLADGTNRGLAARMNEVLLAADLPYLVWVAADDMLAPGGLSLLARTVATYPATDVVFGDLEVMDHYGISRGYSRPADTWQGGVARRYLNGGHPYWDLLRYNNFIPGGMTLIRTSALRSVGGYDESIRTTEDLNMWLTIGRTSEFRYVGQAVGRYRVVPGSKSRREKTVVLEHAGLLRRRTEGDAVARSMVAKLVALRWALSLARTRGRPAVTLAELSAAAGVPTRRIVRKLPAALTLPAIEIVRHRLARRRPSRPKPAHH